MQGIVERIKRAVVIKDEFVESIANEIRDALLEADVAYEIAEGIKKKIIQRYKKESEPGMSKREQLLKLVYEELVSVLGEEAKVELRPKRILLLGLFGSGKTTFAAKLARFYKLRNLSVALICCDVVREAAYEQLEQLAKKAKVIFYGEKENKDASSIAKHALEKLKNVDILIFDSSGRNALDDEMIRELKELASVVKPDEKILVLPADIGKAAKEQVKAFNEAVGITGIAVTKLDATAKAGGALVASVISGAKVLFLSTGEHLHELELYSPRKFIARLLGFPDLETLLEKMKETKVTKIAEKAMKAELTLRDFVEQFSEIRKMGGFANVLSMLGLGGKIDEELLSLQEEKVKKWRYIIDSMTPEERENPEIVDASRIRRIARGSGTSESDVRELLKAYKQAKKLMKLVKPSLLRGLAGFGKMRELTKLLRKIKF